jgi:hypothetical protein
MLPEHENRLGKGGGSGSKPDSEQVRGRCGLVNQGRVARLTRSCRIVENLTGSTIVCLYPLENLIKQLSAGVSAETEVGARVGVAVSF